MRGFKAYSRSHARGVSFLPAAPAQAPEVAGFETRKTVFWYRRDEIVTPRFTEFEEGIRHLGTNRVLATILGTCIAGTGSKKTGEWILATGDQITS